MIVDSKLALEVMDKFVEEGLSDPNEYIRRLEFEAMKLEVQKTRGAK